MSFQSRIGATKQASCIRNLEQQWATPFSTEYQDVGQEPEVVIYSKFQ